MKSATDIQPPVLDRSNSVLSAARTVHFIDIENLAEGASMNFRDVEQVRYRYLEQVHIGPTDRVVIGVSHYAAEAVQYGWNGAEVHKRSGKDGADLVLLEKINELLNCEFPTAQFSQVVIASGDHIFADACARVSEHFSHLTVVARNRKSLSRELRAICSDVRLLTHAPVTMAAAV